VTPTTFIRGVSMTFRKIKLGRKRKRKLGVSKGLGESITPNSTEVQKRLGRMRGKKGGSQSEGGLPEKGKISG